MLDKRYRTPNRESRDWHHWAHKTQDGDKQSKMKTHNIESYKDEQPSNYGGEPRLLFPASYKTPAVLLTEQFSKSLFSNIGLLVQNAL